MRQPEKTIALYRRRTKSSASDGTRRRNCLIKAGSSTSFLLVNKLALEDMGHKSFRHISSTPRIERLSLVFASFRSAVLSIVNCKYLGKRHVPRCPELWCELDGGTMREPWRKGNISSVHACNRTKRHRVFTVAFLSSCCCGIHLQANSP